MTKEVASSETLKEAARIELGMESFLKPGVLKLLLQLLKICTDSNNCRVLLFRDLWQKVTVSVRKVTGKLQHL